MNSSDGSRKRIAILGAQIYETYQKEFVEGCMSECFPKNYDVCVFAMHNKNMDTAERELGEGNIFNLCNFNEFDGVIVLCDTLLVPGAMKNIDNRLRKEYNGAVLYIDKTSDVFPYFMYEHYTPMYHTIEHLINVHGYKDIAFLTGKDWHNSSKIRLHAFLDAMRDNDLEVKDSRIFYGDFWYTSGENVGDILGNDKENLPEAVACANDYMAIGVATALNRHGIRVPEDVAVIGYDSVEEGRESPSPITSMKMPGRELGIHASRCLEILMKGGNSYDFPEFKYPKKMYMGNSCGCHKEPIIRYGNRPTWETDLSNGGFMASQNRILENMLSGGTFRNCMDTVQSYTFQIRDFDSFDMCLNSNWKEDMADFDDKIIRLGYTDKILNVLSCGKSGEGADKLSFDNFFDKSKMLPRLYDANRPPCCFIFNPLYFDDVCFGFSVMGQTENLSRVDETYLLWLKSIMFGFESLRRINVLRKSSADTIERVQYKDPLTGLFNYNGFVKHAQPMIERELQLHCYISLVALDVVGLAEINAIYGRSEGDNAIMELAEIIEEVSDEGAICCRLGNDEFIVAELSETSDAAGKIAEKIKAAIKERTSDRKYEISVTSGGVVNRINMMSDMEESVNAAVSAKNREKIKSQKLLTNSVLTPEELKVAVKVKALLDENKFNYHFQPIVDARTGEIFAYEALMRPDINPYIPPNVVLEYAEHFGRIDDVENYTFMNIINIYEENSEKFTNKKIFINSLPGVRVKPENDDFVYTKLGEYSDKFIIELTEQREADDDTLHIMKTRLDDLGVKTAVDDYGTGYSNVVNIMRYTPNFVKVDRLLVSGIQNNMQSQYFVKNIVQFAHDNDIYVIAEGVENLDELNACIKLDVDYIQGYYTARPNAMVVPGISEAIKKEIVSANAFRPSYYA